MGLIIWLVSPDWLSTWTRQNIAWNQIEPKRPCQHIEELARNHEARSYRIQTSNGAPISSARALAFFLFKLEVTNVRVRWCVRVCMCGWASPNETIMIFPPRVREKEREHHQPYTLVVIHIYTYTRWPNHLLPSHHWSDPEESCISINARRSTPE